MKYRTFFLFVFTLGIALVAGVDRNVWADADPAPPAPRWREPWQQVIADWLATLQADELATPLRELDTSRLDPAELRRNWAMVSGYAPPLVFATDALTIPTKDFLWQGGIWRPDLPATQYTLQHWLERGQIWLPSHPTTACHLAWLYSWDRPWNPYHGDANVARRAAVIALVDLLMEREQIFWFHDADSPRPALGPNLHTGLFGFTTTFNAFTCWKVQAVLPAAVRQAWQTGLLDLCHRLAASPPTGPENMRLSVPVAMAYAGLATADPWVLAETKRQTQQLAIEMFHAAGYYPDGGQPDGSYNGIALHRVTELWSITQQPELLERLRQAYRLKGYLTLIEPDGSWLSPSHFNLRCKSSFANDQYAGREVQMALEVPEAVPYLRRDWRADVTTAMVTNLFQRYGATPRKKVERPSPWGEGVRVSTWAALLNLPYVLYHEHDAPLEQLVATGPVLPLQGADDNFAVNLGDEFFCVRKPGYYIILYAGPVSPFDNGKTNQHNMLKGAGGYLNGFAGGGISSFWTPAAGTMLIGRMTAVEAYERQEKEFPWHTYLLGGWQDWVNNHVVGRTRTGKILTSARTAAPRSEWSPEQSTLQISGSMPNELPRQGKICDAHVSYNRRYKFADDQVDVRLDLTTDRPLEFTALYETLPVHLAADLTIRYLGAEGRVLPERGQQVMGVHTIELRRAAGGLRIEFEKAVTIALVSEPLVSKQHGPAVRCRAVQIELPHTLAPDSPTQMKYSLVPFRNPQSAIQGPGPPPD